MIPKHIIVKAIEGGWKSPTHYYWRDYQGGVVIDPLFWQALGKAKGWNVEHITKDGDTAKNHRGYRICSKFCGKEWLYHSTQFFDLLMTGGDIEKFWEDLISK